MKLDFQFKQKYSVDDLVEIMRILRSENGCPWDREQTHESIRRSFIEETYEVIEAINKQDCHLLCEELGDVLMQVVFHAQIEAEKQVFDFSDVADGVCKKLIERHPHVFGDVEVQSADDVLVNWDKIKSASKQRKTTADKMQSVPRELPALMRADKIQSQAAKVGFDWETPDGALQKIPEEQAELLKAVAAGDRENTFEELGDLLFAAVNAARKLHIDPEEALTAATDKFQKRFTKVEALAKARGVDMENTPLEMLDRLWDEVKAEEKAES
ncbi:MAG: nucleoside triphosphate pyrophosphohydrolase [Candidatus Fimenecus sp.]